MTSAKTLRPIVTVQSTCNKFVQCSVFDCHWFLYSLMLRYLVYRETGFHSPQVLTRTEISRRTYSIELSKKREIFSIHDGPVNWVDIESIDWR